MAMPTPHRRAFSQIQNTISKSSIKASISKSVIAARDEAVAFRGTEKENADHMPVALKNKETLSEKEVNIEPVKKTEVFKPKRYEVPGETFDYLDNFDFDAPIETAPPDEAAPSVFHVDGFLPPEERISSLSPHFWNRFLMPSIDFDNKENIEDLFANLHDSCDLDQIDNDLANLELQKSSLHK